MVAAKQQEDAAVQMQIENRRDVLLFMCGGSLDCCSYNCARSDAPSAIGLWAYARPGFPRRGVWRKVRGETWSPARSESVLPCTKIGIHVHLFSARGWTSCYSRLAAAKSLGFSLSTFG